MSRVTARGRQPLWGTVLLLSASAVILPLVAVPSRSQPTEGGLGAAPAAEPATVEATVPAITGKILNVRDFGATGDGTTIDREKIQNAVDAAKPGDGVYFPAGTYKLDDSIKVLTSNLTIYGDGPDSVIFHGIRRGFDLGIFNEPLSGLVVHKLKFLGLPGKFQADGNHSPAIQIVGPKDTVIKDCDFQGSGFGVNNVGKTRGTRIDQCRIDGWGEVGIFCNGGEQITNCRLIQNDTDKNGERSSHGLYIHSLAHDVLVQDTLIQNARKYGAQIYGEEHGTTIERTTFRRVTFKDCNEALKVQQGWPDAARSKGLLVEDCTFHGTYRGPAMAFKGGEGVTIRNNVIEDNTNGALVLGRWNSYEWGMTITDMLFTGNTVRNCGVGVFALASSGGHFERVTIEKNDFINCQVVADLQDAGPGITFTP